MFDVDRGPHQLKETTQRLVVEVELQGAPFPRRDHLANSRQLYVVEHLRLQVGSHDLNLFHYDQLAGVASAPMEESRR